MRLQVGNLKYRSISARNAPKNLLPPLSCCSQFTGFHFSLVVSNVIFSLCDCLSLRVFVCAYVRSIIMTVMEHSKHLFDFQRATTPLFDVYSSVLGAHTPSHTSFSNILTFFRRRRRRRRRMDEPIACNFGCVSNLVPKGVPRYRLLEHCWKKWV